MIKTFAMTGVTEKSLLWDQGLFSDLAMHVNIANCSFGFFEAETEREGGLITPPVNVSAGLKPKEKI